MLTDERLSEIEAREKAATDGPWPDDLRNVITVHQGPLGDIRRVHISGPDRAYIVHARTDIPDLLAEVRRLKRIEEAAREVHDAWLWWRKNETDNCITVPERAHRALHKALNDGDLT